MQCSSNDFDWNPDTVARLRSLWAEGLSTAEIGRRMGVSKNAVVGKSHRLNLPARPSPIRRDGVRKPPVARRPRRPSLAEQRPQCGYHENDFEHRNSDPMESRASAQTIPNRRPSHDRFWPIVQSM
jgi:hypothetical protein